MKIFFFTPLSFLACTDPGSTYTYTVRNESGVSLRLRGYNFTMVEKGSVITKTTLFLTKQLIFVIIIIFIC